MVPIMVDGTTVKITRNFHDALVHLQHEEDDVVLWMGALCRLSTSKTTEEKSHQVRQMGEIYTNSSYKYGCIFRACGG